MRAAMAKVIVERPRRVERVTPKGRAVAQGRQIISAEARVLGADGKVLAHGTSTILVVGPR